MFMKKHILLFIIYLIVLPVYSNSTGEVFVDGKGILRFKDSNKEASFYGVNYTLPFAYAYRAVDYLGLNHKEAIDKDVYHLSRLGFNAYRIHIWDVEISDGQGNLIENNHLDLLDYLINELRKRGIYVFITTMTNFGNGYPEKNIDTNAFSYLYEKCKIHEDPNAIEAQQKYIAQLLNHVNPYTKKAYKEDQNIVGFEINNEPCHAHSIDQTKAYINSMLKAISTTQNTKPIFYNVSHNIDYAQAYFDTKIQGTTYQWYPIGLVSGRTMKGNFLPNVDDFNIPFSDLKGFENKAKAIYEFDPADITYSYMYPAMARSFRNQGFQWITQFAYDPLDIAWNNTEYQTHFLNLAYTPQKAISMAIAAEVVFNTPLHKEYPKYPNNTVFDDFSVSYLSDQSEYNSDERFYYSNGSLNQPKDKSRLKKIKGYGNSPIVQYGGTGAYFLDKLDDGSWRLEVMPDAVQVEDPFEKTSLKKEVVSILWNNWNMKIDLSNLNNDFYVLGINEGNNTETKAIDKTFNISPGTYLIGNDLAVLKTKSKDRAATVDNVFLADFVAPQSRVNDFKVIHKPQFSAEIGQDLKIEAVVIGPAKPDSVIIYTDEISFWNEHNPYVKMEVASGYTYTAKIQAKDIKKGLLSYNIIVCKDGKYTTFPNGHEGNPLDWDYYKKDYWKTIVLDTDQPIEIFKVHDFNTYLDTYSTSEKSYMKSQIEVSLDDIDMISYSFVNAFDSDRFFWRKNITDHLLGRNNKLQESTKINLLLGDIDTIKKLRVGFITKDGFTYSTTIDIQPTNKKYEINFTDLKQDITYLFPNAYPSFMNKTFEPDIKIPFEKENIEFFEMSTIEPLNPNSAIGIRSIWID